jgi:hypothetical protein
VAARDGDEPHSLAKRAKVREFSLVLFGTSDAPALPAMHCRTVLALSALTLGSIAGCGRDTNTPDDVVAEQNAQRERANMQPPDPPPAIPPSLVQADAPPVALAPTDPNADPQAIAAAEQAREQAAQQARDKAKWQKDALDADRRATYEYARERLENANARVVRVNNMSSRVAPTRRGQFNTDMTTFGSKKVKLQSIMDSLSSSGQSWKRTREDLERAIEELDAAATKLEGDVF